MKIFVKLGVLIGLLVCDRDTGHFGRGESHDHARRQVLRCLFG